MLGWAVHAFRCAFDVVIHYSINKFNNVVAVRSRLYGTIFSMCLLPFRSAENSFSIDTHVRAPVCPFRLPVVDEKSMGSNW